MALAYKTGTVTNQVDLLSEIKTFCCTDNDWSLLAEHDETYCFSNPGEGLNATETGHVIHIHRTDSYSQDVYMHLYACYQALGTPYKNQYASNSFWNYLGFRARTYHNFGISFCGSRGYNSGGTEWWDNTTPSTAISSHTACRGSAIGFMFGQTMTYYFFAVGDSIHIAIEVFPDEWQHMSFGTIIKSETGSSGYVGGQYFMGSNCDDGASQHPGCVTDADAPFGTTNESFPWSDRGVHYGWGNPTYYMYCEQENATANPSGGWSSNWSYKSIPDATTQDFSIKVGIPDYRQTQGGYKGFYGNLTGCSPSTLTSLSPQFPLWVRKMRADITEYVYLGYPEGVRFLNMKALNSKQINTLGADDWMIFPAGRLPGTYDFNSPGLSYLKG